MPQHEGIDVACPAPCVAALENADRVRCCSPAVRAVAPAQVAPAEQQLALRLRSRAPRAGACCASRAFGNKVTEWPKKSFFKKPCALPPGRKRPTLPPKRPTLPLEQLTLAPLASPKPPQAVVISPCSLAKSGPKKYRLRLRPVLGSRGKQQQRRWWWWRQRRRRSTKNAGNRSGATAVRP